MRFDTVAIVGVGLIGGSIGKALKARGLAGQVVGIGREKNSLDRAISIGAIDRAELSIVKGVINTDLVIVCTPVDRIASQVIEVARHCPPHAIITDAGSTKRSIVEAIEAIEAVELPLGVKYVGSHPIAGSARSGPEAADANLFRDRTTVVTPTKHSTEAGVVSIEEFWRALGSKTVRLDARRHDELLAWTSHLPHIVASVLAGLIPEEAIPFAGTGLRDTTRIAAGDPSLWMPIIDQNREEILSCLCRFRDQIDSVIGRMGERDDGRVLELLERGKRGRDALGN